MRAYALIVLCIFICGSHCFAYPDSEDSVEESSEELTEDSSDEKEVNRTADGLCTIEQK